MVNVRTNHQPVTSYSWDLLGRGRCEWQSPAEWWNNWENMQKLSTHSHYGDSQGHTPTLTHLVPSGGLTTLTEVNASASDTWTHHQPVSAPRWSYYTRAPRTPPRVSVDRWKEAPPRLPCDTSSARNLTGRTTCQSKSGNETAQSVSSISSTFERFSES